MKDFQVEELAMIVEKYGLSEIEVSQGDTRIVLKRQAMVEARPTKMPPSFSHITEMKALQDELAEKSIPHQDGPKPIKKNPDGASVKAPLAGIFYRQPKPGEPPYAEVGQHVKKGDIVCLVEAMKMINEIPATCDGIIKEFCVENETFVEFDSPLVIIDEE